MKPKLLISAVLIILIYSSSLAQQRPQINFEDLIINAELDYTNVIEARKAALNSGTPVNIYLEEGIFIEAKGVEDGKPVYSVIRNLLHPFKDSDVMFYEEAEASFNFESARINFGNGVIINPASGKHAVEPSPESRLVNYLLVSESGDNSVMLLDFSTGDLLNPNFIPPQSTLTIPKQALQSPRSTVSISDQTEDVVFDYDTSGALIGIFAPNIGPHNGILDNIRGHNYRPGNNHLVVCNAQGGNFNRVVEFDTMGNYIGAFITDNSGGLLSPFDIIFRANDVLVTGSTSSAAHRYDLSGNYLDDFAVNILFPQQMVEFPNGNVGIASFGSSGGLKIYSSAGILVNDFTSVTGLRGVHYLGSGNIIVTNSSGVHEIDGTTGGFIRTVVAGVNAQYVTSCNFSLDATPVELVSFNASVNNNSVRLSWITSSELNNSGFEVQKYKVQSIMDKVNEDWQILTFISGSGTTTEQQQYSFIDNLALNLDQQIKYRLKQIDFNGSFEYSKEIEVEINNLPKEFALFQNYPNPFNPVTKIKYAVPAASSPFQKGRTEEGFVTLKIYDILGNQVAILVNEAKEPGEYEVEFDASKLGSGVYLYKISAGNFTQSRKMLLLK